MADKIYLTATDLQERWGVSAHVFGAMKKNGNLPPETVLNKASLYHIDSVVKFETDKEAAAH